MKQKVSNIILLMYSAQFIKFKRLAISVKRSNFKKAYLPMFYKARRPKTSVNVITYKDNEIIEYSAPSTNYVYKITLAR